MNEPEFRKQVKDAFEHLYDLAYLSSHPLLSQLVHLPGSARSTRAQKLRSILKESIEAIRPQQDLPSTAPEWRSYHALRYRYTQGMTMAQVESTLGISQRQLQRDFHKGLDAVIALLEERRSWDDAAAAAEPELPGGETGEVQQLRNEMNHWQLVREPAEVATLLESARWMLQSSVGQNAVKLRVELPKRLKPALVDSTLTRQALFQILRLMVQHGQGEEIVLKADAVNNHIAIWLRSAATPTGAAAPINPGAADWQMAQLLIERQGGTLALETPRSADEQVVITLPQANPPRVLVIDDNPAIHQLLERYLTPNFYEVVHAHAGAEASQTVLETQPDFIILDVMMPAMDGWQVLRGLQANATTAKIPVIVCSVLREPELAFSLGARAYLKKPVERLELLTTLAEIRAAPGPAAEDPAAAP